MNFLCFNLLFNETVSQRRHIVHFHNRNLGWHFQCGAIMDSRAAECVRVRLMSSLCLRSVLNRTPVHLIHEIILVDDFSGDGEQHLETHTHTLACSRLETAETRAGQRQECVCGSWVLTLRMTVRILGQRRGRRAACAQSSLQLRPSPSDIRWNRLDGDVHLKC